MPNSIIPYIIAVILALAGAYCLFKKDKKDKKKVMMILGVVLLAGAAFAGAWQYGLLANYGILPIGVIAIPGTGVSLSTAPTSTGTITGACVGVEDTTVTWSWVNKYTSAAGGGTHRYRVSTDGGTTFGPATTVSDLGTATLSPGNVVQTLFGNATDGTYFGVLTQEVIPCKGTYTLDAQAVANGSLTINVFNEEGNLIDSSGENETIGAGDAVNLKVEVQASNKKGFPYGGVFIVEVNGTSVDEEDTELTFQDLPIRKLSSNPSVQTVATVDSRQISFEVGAFEGTALHTGSLYLKADDTYDPTDAVDPKIVFLPYDYYTNEDNGGAFEGPAVQDEVNAQTFAHVTSKTVSVD